MSEPLPLHCDRCWAILPTTIPSKRTMGEHGAGLCPLRETAQERDLRRLSEWGEILGFRFLPDKMWEVTA